MGMVPVRVSAGALSLLLLIGSIAASPSARADSLPTVSVGDVSAVEGDSGRALLRVPVDLSSAAAVTVKVPYRILVSPDGTADNADAVLTQGTVTFLPGIVTKPVGVLTIGDTTPETDQHVIVKLGSPVGGATLGDDTGLVTIIDDDANGENPGIEASIGEVVLTEADAGMHRGYIPITLSRPATAITKIGFQMDCQSSGLISDLTMKRSGTVTFQIGQRVKDLSFLLGADVQPDEIKNIVEHITSQLASVKVLDNRGDATINDDDGSLPSNPGFAVPGFASDSGTTASTFNGQGVGGTEQVSLTPTGGEPTTFYRDPGTGGGGGSPQSLSMSQDGRFVAFSSPQTDLVPNDTNQMVDVFVRDRATNTTERVSLKSDGSQINHADIPVTLNYDADAAATAPVMSADGQYVAFISLASLIPSDSASTSSQLNDSYLYDRVTHAVEPLSVDSAGTFIHGIGGVFAISTHGRYVAMRRDDQILVRDRLAGTTTTVYQDSFGTAPVMSANGQFVITPSRGIGCLDQELVLIDLQTGATERIDVADDGTGASQENQAAVISYLPSVSADGRFVAFKAAAWNLVPGLTGPTNSDGTVDWSLMHAFVRDRNQLSTTIVGLTATGLLPPATGIYDNVTINDDGNMVGVSARHGGPGQWFDIGAGTTGAIGPPASDSHLGSRFGPTAMSGDGRYISYISASRLNAQVVLGDAFVQRLR